MRKTLEAVLFCGLSLGLGTSSFATTWNAANDLAANVTANTTYLNPNGQWSYGYEDFTSAPALSFTKYTTAQQTNAVTGLAGDPFLKGWAYDASHQVPDVTVNVGPPHSPPFGLGDTPIATDEIFVHPGSEPFGGTPDETVVRWTAPATGSYNVSGYWRVIDGAAAGEIDYLQLNGVNIDSTPISHGSGLATITPTILNLNGGDTLDFVVGPDASHNNAGDHTAFNATITTVPEPMAIGLLGISSLGLLRRRAK